MHEKIDRINEDMLVPELLVGISKKWVRARRLLPLRINKRIVIATPDLTDINSLIALREILGIEAEPVIAEESEIVKAIDRCYFILSTDRMIAPLSEDIKEDESSRIYVQKPEDLLEDTEDAPVRRFVNSMLMDALKKRATDIHIEPKDEFLQIRYRIDGVLYPQTSPPLNLADAVITRLKVMGQMDIGERRLPQDGTARIRIGEKEFDIRISSVPTTTGERLVLRLLDKDAVFRPLSSLGMSEKIYNEFMECIKYPNGMLIVCGPTGSGKTTTLYAALSTLDAMHRNIITVEDPVEYKLAGISQIQVNPKIGLTFSTCLRHILRQDPDVILVGEIRDAETAEIAIRASLTGHLVFSTLHTNDAVGAVVRMLDMGIAGYLLASTVRAMMAQRLVRVLCNVCKEKKVFFHQDGIPAVMIDRLKNREVWMKRGCKECLEGYIGRTGLFELMRVDEEIKELMRMKGKLLDEKRLFDTVLNKGMSTLIDDGIEKILMGITSVDEVMSVCYSKN